MTTIKQILRESYAEDDKFTHTSMISPKGRYFITRKNIESFFNNYETNKYGLTENPPAYSMLRFDFDIKRTEYNNENRFYSANDLKVIITSINQELKRIIKIDDSKVVCCLLEKDIYLKSAEKKIYSGGFHLQYLHIFMKQGDMVALVENIKKFVFDKTNIEFDTGVYRNPWLMYGSKKDEKLQPYILTKIFDISFNEMTQIQAFSEYQIFNIETEDPIKITEDNIHDMLPRILSINPYNRSGDYDAIPNTIQVPQIKFVEKPNKVDNREVEEKLVEAKKLLSILKSSRVDEYADWMTIGWCLFSISQGCEEGLELWDDVSKLSDKYDDCACEREWSGMKIGNYTLGTLHKFAREDDKKRYDEIFKKEDNWVRNLVYNLTDMNCAEVYMAHNEGEVFFTKSNGWVIFNKTTKFWSLNNDKSSLVYPISKFFSETIKEYMIEFVKTCDCGVKEDNETIKLITKARQKVETSKFSAGVITQLQSVATVNDDIMNKFDANPALFAFKCGHIYNIQTQEIRSITKEDFIITHCGYNLPNKNTLAIKKVRELIKSMCKDEEQLKSILSMLSCFVYGNNKNELFFVLTGTGGNGKGLLDKFLQVSLGGYYKAVDMKQFTHYEKDGNRANSDIASAQYSRCLSASETETDKNNKLITSQIKKYSGNDPVTARFLNKNSFTFLPKFCILMLVNDLPSLSIMDGGVKRRMKIGELPFSFVENNGQELKPNEKYADDTLKTFLQTSTEYRDGFLYLLFDTWTEFGGKFYENADTKEFTDNYFGCQNPVKLWFDQYYEVCETEKIKSSDLFSEASIELAVTSTQFGRYMKEFCKSKATKNGIVYLCKKKPFKQIEFEL